MKRSIRPCHSKCEKVDYALMVSVSVERLIGPWLDLIRDGAPFTGPKKKQVQHNTDHFEKNISELTDKVVELNSHTLL